MNDHVKQWQRALGVAADGDFGPDTLAASMQALHAPAPQPLPVLPWLTEGRKVIGLHEVRDNAALTAWLMSDGKRLGDPKALPWCGDFAETAMKRGLPTEVFSGPVGENPYYARNWSSFGKATLPVYGAVLVFERGPTSGHVGFGVGQTKDNFLVLGGNQGDTVSIVPIAKGRLLAARWPSSFPNPEVLLPFTMTGGATSINEA
jgi:uncharacterized protein (TIGR02594 family)